LQRLDHGEDCRRIDRAGAHELHQVRRIAAMILRAREPRSDATPPIPS
jgi:hypothetical protein